MRTTINLNDKVYQALKVRAAQSNSSLSKIVEEAVKYQLLEDLEDIEDAKRRQGKPLESFESLVKQFKAEGLL
jgi:plasmid stability protein